MANMGGALMGIGVGTGEQKAVTAAEAAITSPLLEDISIDGAKGLLINVTCGPDVTIMEINQAISMIQKRAHPDVHLIFGARIDEGLYNEVRITVIATGFDHQTQDERLMAVKEAAKESIAKERALASEAVNPTEGNRHSGSPAAVEVVAALSPSPSMVEVAAPESASATVMEPVTPKPVVNHPLAVESAVPAVPTPTQTHLLNDWEVPAYVRRRSEVHLKGEGTNE